MKEEKTTIVTGGAQGIGLGITRELLAAGEQVAVFDIDEEALHALRMEFKGAPMLTLACDVADELAVADSVRRTLGRFGQLDGLVNNAGIADPHCGPLESLELADWQKWLNANLTGAFLAAKHSLPHLREMKGAIVNIASTRALQSEPHTEAYAASKGGLVSLTHALAVSLSGAVRVNAISPGWIAVEDYQKPSQRQAPQFRPIDHEQHPAGRVGTPRDIAKLTAFLLSKDAGFITGQNFIADGGMTKKMIYHP